MKKIVTLALFLTTCLDANAFGIKEALEKAYTTNPLIKSYQEEYIGSLQEFPKALSQNFLPDIRAKTDIANSKQRETINQNYARGEKSSRSIIATQNIFSGGSSMASMAAVKHKLDAAKLKYVSKEQEFILNGILTYVELIAAKEKLEASKSFVSSSQKEYEASEEKLKVGEATTTDVALAKAQYSQSLADLANANAGLLTKRSAFEVYFGESSDDISLPEVPNDLPDTFDNFLSKAKLTNINSRISESSLKAAKNVNLASQGSLLPKVNAVVKTEDNISKNETNFNQTKGRSVTTVLQFDIPILESGGAEYSKIRESKAQLRKAVHELDYTRKSTETKLISDWEIFTASKQSMIFANEAMEARKLAYEGMKSRYDVGLTPITDVLKAEKDYYDSVVQNIQVKEQHIKAAYTIKSDLAQLTAKDLGLKVKLFDVEAEFRKTKFKVIGF
jgi:outer membrane protein